MVEVDAGRVYFYKKKEKEQEVEIKSKRLKGKYKGLMMKASSAILSTLSAGVFTGYLYLDRQPFDVSNYRLLTGEEYAQLISDYREKSIPFENKVNQDPNILVDGSFTLPKNSQALINIEIEQDLNAYTLVDKETKKPQKDFNPVYNPEDRIKLYMVNVAVDGKRKYIVPVVTTPYVDGFPDPSLQLSGLGEGVHSLTLYQDKEPLDKNKVKLEIKVPMGNSIMRDIIERTPMLAYRTNTKNNRAINSPLITSIEIKRNGDELLVSYVSNFTNENSGMKPDQRRDRFGRTYDQEAAKIDIYKNGKLEKEFYEARGHDYLAFHDKYSGKQPKLQIETNNNNFSNILDSNIYFSPVALRIYGDTTVDEFLRTDWRILQTLSLREELSLGQITPEQAIEYKKRK